MMFFLTILVSMVMSVQYASCFLHSIPLPKTLKKCYVERSYHVKPTQIPAQTIQADCIRELLYDDNNEFYKGPKLTENSHNFIKSVMRRIEGEAHELLNQHKRRRNRRQWLIWRVRQEARTLSRRQWRRFTRRLNELKNDFSVERNISVYDIIAVIHSGTEVRTAHFGPNFPAWHQIYLLILESLLGVPLPYCDSTLDNEMGNPADTILFSNRYYGTGNGLVRNGPFRDWRTITNSPLVRNINSAGGSLLTRRAINWILEATSMRQIVEPVRGFGVLRSLERHHNGFHIWVDGFMNGLNTAAYDPIFFCHHAMVDSIWSNWRDRMRENNLTVVYPDTNQPRHRSDANSTFSPYGQIQNIDQLRPLYKDIVRYAPYPRFPNCYGQDVIVNTTTSQCMSRSRRSAQIIPESRRDGAGAAAFSAARDIEVPEYPRDPVQIGQTFSSQGTVFVDSRAEKTPLQTSGASAATMFLGEILKMKYRLRQRSIRIRRGISYSARQNVHSPHSHMNSFLINGRIDVRNWSFIYAEILYLKPRNTEPHFQYPSLISNCHESLGEAKIYVESQGLDYLGHYKDFVTIDKTRDSAKDTVLIGVKKPSEKNSEFILTAYDQCGTACHATCFNHTAHQPDYTPCSGVFRLTNVLPKMYGETVFNSLTKQWTIKLGSTMLSRRNPAPVRFICDYKNKWPWQLD